MTDFQFYLNRQGARGPQGYKGDKGDDGKTPVPRTGTNTPIETTVIFDTGDGNPYETPNLKYPIEDRGGNMVMLDRTNNTQYYGTSDQATDNSYGIVKLATPESVLDDPLDNDVVTYELFDDNNQAIKTVTDGLAGDITQLNTDLGAEVTNRTNADTQLTNKINTDVGNEATARSNADTALSGRIDDLTTSKANKSDVYTKTQTDSLLNNKSNVGHTHNYNEITNKPDIGNGTITISQGGVVKGSFTTNQLSNSTIALDAGGGGGVTYTAGPGITINQNDEISANVDNNTIVIDGNLLKANIPDVSNFVSNTQLASTLESYPTNNALSNAITYQTVSVPTPATYTFDRIMNLNIWEYATNPDVETGGGWTKVGTSTYTRNNQLVIPSDSSYNNGLWVTLLYLQGTECVKCKSGYTFSFECNPQISISYYSPEDGDTLITQQITINTPTNEVFNISSSSYGYTSLNIGVLKNIYIKHLMVQYNYDGNGHTPSMFLYPLYSFNGEVEVYTKSEGTPTTTTKAVIASTAVDGTTIGVNSSGQLQSLVEEPGTATSSTLGLVKPDNSTISVDSSGTISAITTPALIIDSVNHTALVNPIAINTNNQLIVVTDNSGTDKLTISGNAAIGVGPIEVYNYPISGYYPWDTDESSNVVTINNSTGYVSFSNDIAYAEYSGQIYSRNTFIPNDLYVDSFRLQFTTGSNVDKVASSNSAILFADIDGYFYYTLKISENHFIISVPTSGMTKEEFILSGYLVEADTPYTIAINKDLNQTNVFFVSIQNQNIWDFYSDSITTTATPSFSSLPTTLNLSRQGYGVLTSIDLDGSNLPPGLNRVIVDKQMQISLSYDPETLDLEYGALKVKPSIDGGTL